MKITVINGNTRHGSTWHCMDLIMEELSKYEEIEKTEFTLPKDLPEFCRGCFSCFLNGEDTCPHASFVAPIVKAVLDADLIVLTSPVYGMDVTGQMKAFIDHLCFMWVSHRPNPRMFTKIGLTVTTTAGAGLKHTSKTMKNSLDFWCVRKNTFV
jgi:multimeric flavodoxin WrbA